MKNTIAAHEVLPADNMKNKMLLDVPFKKHVAQPKETHKDINDFFWMGFTPNFEQALDATPNNRKAQKNVKSVIPEEWFTFDRAEIGGPFCFFQDTSGSSSYPLTVKKRKGSP